LRQRRHLPARHDAAGAMMAEKLQTPPEKGLIAGFWDV
jgi:hypothetical protein